MQKGVSFSVFARVILPFILALLLRIQPLSIDVQRILHAANLPISNPAKISNELEQIARMQPWREDIWEQIGLIKAASGDEIGAIEALERNDVRSEQGRDTLMQLYLRTGNQEKALAFAREEIQKPHPTETAFRTAVTFSRKSGQFADALDITNRWHQLYPNSHEALYLQGIIRLRQLGDQAATQDLFIANSDYRPEVVGELRNTLVQFNGGQDIAAQKLALARILGKYGEWDIARSLLEDVVRLEPKYAEAWALLGEATFQVGEDGWPAFEHAEALNNQSALVNVLLGIRHRRSGQPEISLVYLQKAITLEPYEARWKVEMAETLVDLGRMSEALNSYLAAYELAPHDPDIVRSLVLFSGNYSIGIQEVGIPAARALILLDDMNAEAQDLMGWLLLKSGDTTSAERFFHRALELNPGFAQANYHLGQLYLLIGRRADADYQLAKVVENLPDHDQLHINAKRLLQP